MFISSVHEELLASEAPATWSSLPYALVEIDKSQIIARANSGTLEAPVWASAHNVRQHTYQFDVTRPAQLRIRLYLPADAGLDNGRCTDPVSGQLIVLPSFEKCGDRPTEWLDLPGETGAVRLTVRFTPHRALNLKSENFEVSSVAHEIGIMPVQYVLPQINAFLALAHERVCRKKDTGQLYALWPLPKDTAAVVKPGATQIDSPFIVPLKFAFKSHSQKYWLLSVFIGGGRLFRRLESDHQFGLPEAHFYTA